MAAFQIARRPVESAVLSVRAMCHCLTPIIDRACVMSAPSSFVEGALAAVCIAGKFLEHSSAIWTTGFTHVEPKNNGGTPPNVSGY